MSEETHPAASARIPALDGLRGLAILLVLLWHVRNGFDASSTIVSDILSVGRLFWSGVDLFFVLSGFLIGGILLDAKDSPRYFTTFYFRRAYRILPLYYVILAVFCLRYLPSGNLRSSVDETTIPLGAFVTFTQNLWMAAWGVWGTVSLGPTWSLAVEEQFYLTAPVIIRTLTRQWLGYVLAGVVLLAPLLRAVLILGLHSNKLAAYVLMPCRADALCWGMLVALLLRNSPAWERLVRKKTRLYWVAAGSLASMVWLNYEGYFYRSTPMATFGYSLVAFFYTCCLLLALLKTPWLEQVLCNKWLIELGGISYCVYLIHIPMIEYGRKLLNTAFHHFGFGFQHAQTITQFLGALLGVGFALAVAKLSWRYLERPMLRRGHAHKY